MKNIAQFTITKHDNDGVYYVAEGVELPIATQGATLDELEANMREAITLYFEEEERDAKTPTPRVRPAILANFELTYA